MEYNYFAYEKNEANITVHKLAKWFREEKFEGDVNEGYISFHSQNNYDEIWGSNAKLKIEWSKKERVDFFHAKEVQASIDTYNAINVVVIKKERDWLNSHEFSYWFGKRTKMVRKRYYPENFIHGIFYCDMTLRQISMTAEIIREHYEGFKPYILECYNSIICH